MLRESGHEHFNGSVVIPIFDEEGHVAGMYGRKITPIYCQGTAAPVPAGAAPRGLQLGSACGCRRRSSCARR